MIEQKYIDRFWKYVDVVEPDQCWIWTAYKNRKGYGQFRYKRKTIKSHRLSWQIRNGDIPDNLHVLHHCDNPACCNPDHLFLGTHQDNMNDRNNKNRQSKGEELPQAKLTENQVIQIREEYETGNISQRELAEKYDMRRRNIGLIVNRKRWKHI